MAVFKGNTCKAKVLGSGLFAMRVEPESLKIPALVSGRSNGEGREPFRNSCLFPL